MPLETVGSAYFSYIKTIVWVIYITGLLSTLYLGFILKPLLSSPSEPENETTPRQTFLYAVKHNYCLLVAAILFLTIQSSFLLYNIANVLTILGFCLICALIVYGLKTYRSPGVWFLSIFLLYFAIEQAFGFKTFGIIVSILPVNITILLFVIVCLSVASYSAWVIGKHTTTLISLILWTIFLILAYHSTILFWSFLWIDIPWESVKSILSFGQIEKWYLIAIGIMSVVIVIRILHDFKEMKSQKGFKLFTLLVFVYLFYLFALVPGYLRATRALICQDHLKSLLIWTGSLTGGISIILTTGNKRIFTMNHNTASLIITHTLAILLALVAMQINLSAYQVSGSLI